MSELGSETPYKNDGERKEVKDIEVAVDIFEVMKNSIDKYGGRVDHTLPQEYWKDCNHIQKVDWLREHIAIIIKELLELNITGSRELAIARTNSYNHLCEARFWLGFELQRIKEQNK